MNPTAKATKLDRLTPAPWNPRSIKDGRFANLCRSIEADPEFLWRRPVLAMADGTIYAGNMRYRAAQQLGHESIPAILEDIPEQLAKERALRDNQQWGEWVEDDLAALLGELKAGESDLDLLGFDEGELARLLGTATEVDFPELADGARSPFRIMTFTVSADQEASISAALSRAKGAGPFPAGNENSNGNALARIAESYP